MKIKKKYIIIIVVLLIFLFFIFIFECSKIKNNKEPVDMDQNINLNMTDNEIEFICNVIESHMGPWNKDYKGNEVLPKPVNKYQRFVHMCDFLASRKFLNTKFNNNEIID